MYYDRGVQRHTPNIPFSLESPEKSRWTSEKQQKAKRENKSRKEKYLDAFNQWSLVLNTDSALTHPRPEHTEEF